MVAENVVTDRQTDTHTSKPSTATLAVHACQGLKMGIILIKVFGVVAMDNECYK